MLGRYLFMANAASADLLVAKYVARDNPANDRQLTAAQRVIRAQQRELAASVDLLSPSQWCAINTADLDDPSATIPAAVTQFLTRATSVDRFIHYCDLQLAAQWLDRAIELAADDSAIDALPVPQQYGRVTGSYEAYGKFWQALNVRPYGWAEHADRWQDVVRQMFHVQTWVTQAAPDGRVISASERPVPYAKRPADATPDQAFDALGPWRGPMARFYARAPVQVIVGTPHDVGYARRDEAACGTAILTGCSQCLGPSGEVHRVWLTNAGRLACGITTPPDEIPEKWDYDAGASTNWRFSVGQVTGGSVYFMPSMKQYLDVLRPLLAALKGRDLLALVREVWCNVQGKNFWTFYASGKGPDALASFAEMARANADTRELDARRRVVSLAGSGTGLATLANPIAGAIMGGGAAVLLVINQLLPASGFHTTASNDWAGRTEPALEVLRFTDASERAEASVAEQSMPAPPPTPVVRPPGPATVRVTNMPPHGLTFIDAARADDAASRWEDAAQTRWLVPTTSGLRRVVVQSPSGERRAAAVTVSPGGTADVSWEAMSADATRTVSLLSLGLVLPTLLPSATRPVTSEPMVDLTLIAPPSDDGKVLVPGLPAVVGGLRLVAINAARYPAASWPALKISGLAPDGRVVAPLAPEAAALVGALLAPGADLRAYSELDAIPTRDGRLAVAVYARGRGMVPAMVNGTTVTVAGLHRDLYRVMGQAGGLLADHPAA